MTVVGLATALVVTVGFTLWPLVDPYSRVRIRNALIADVGDAEDFHWNGATPPPGFQVETRIPDEFREVVREVLADDLDGGNSFDNARRLAHRLALHPTRVKRIQSTTLEAYRGITADGSGNCSDVSQAFNGLAVTAGIPVREWGMFLDGFNGWGHSFNEVFDETRGKWILLDAYYSFYPTERDSGRPLSVLEMRERLLAGEGVGEIRLVPIRAERLAAAPRNEEELLDYYRWGMAQLALWFSNGVFSYDEHPLVVAGGRISRTLEQGLAILGGAHPRMKIFPTDENRPAIDGMYRARNRFFAGMLLSVVLATLLALQLRRGRAGSTEQDVPAYSKGERPRGWAGEG